MARQTWVARTVGIQTARGGTNDARLAKPENAPSRTARSRRKPRTPKSTPNKSTACPPHKELAGTNC
eukprot:11184206-Lingulodinium_polyedra.AAC.1